MSNLKEIIFKYIKEANKYIDNNMYIYGNYHLRFWERKDINFAPIEKKLGYPLHQSIKDYYNSYSIKNMYGYIKMPTEDEAQIKFKNKYYQIFSFHDTTKTFITHDFKMYFQRKVRDKVRDKLSMIEIAISTDECYFLYLNNQNGQIYYLQVDFDPNEKECLEKPIKQYNSLEELFCDMTQNLKMRLEPNEIEYLFP